MDPICFQSLIETKQRFLQTGQFSAADCDCLDPEVAKSWQASYAAGVRPDSKVYAHELPSSMYGDKYELNTLLVQIAKPLFDNFDNLAGTTNYGLFLFDRDQYVLMKRGTSANDTTAEEAPTILPHTEENVGTMAHVLAMRTKKPYQLLGVEHYCHVIGNTIASAAPILDEQGALLGSLTLSERVKQKDQCGDQYTVHTLALINSMAESFQAQLRLRQQNEQISALNRMQQTLLNMIEDWMITADNRGNIVYVNREAEDLLGASSAHLRGRNIAEFFRMKTELLPLAVAGSRITLEENVFIVPKGIEARLLITLLPVVDERERALQMFTLRIQSIKKINALLSSRLGSFARYTFNDIIGQGQMTRTMVAMGRRFAMTTENILLIGESGTGKELMAQAIHNAYRPTGPFISVNCAAMPRELIESELFGYESGSFTGADKNGRQGKIELAHNGTLFLDEIGDMPIELQAVFLRVLQDKQVMRVGGNRYVGVNFRLIAATNQDLQQQVSQKTFRGDLFYRLSVLTIQLPPLRERGRDAEELARYFIDHYCQKVNLPTPAIAPDVWETIVAYGWPGNIRQLENAMIFAINTARDGVIRVQNLPAEVLGRTAPVAPTQEACYDVRDLENDAICRALAASDYNITQTAKMLGMHRSSLYRKLKSLNIEIR